MSYEDILVDRRERVGIVTLHRPEKRNALGGKMGSEIRRAIDAFNADEGIGAIVITGTDPAFCGGADVGDWKSDLDRGTRESSGSPNGGDELGGLLRRFEADRLRRERTVYRRRADDHAVLRRPYRL